jgi:hypothetical protein
VNVRPNSVVSGPTPAPNWTPVKSPGIPWTTTNATRMNRKATIERAFR